MFQARLFKKMVLIFLLMFIIPYRYWSWGYLYNIITESGE
jgi:hypothetical protein